MYYMAFGICTIFDGGDIETDDMIWKQCREVIFIMEECSTLFKFNATTESKLFLGNVILFFEKV